MKLKKLQQFEGKNYDPKIQSSAILPCLVLFTFQTKGYIIRYKIIHKYSSSVCPFKRLYSLRDKSK